jgi:putative oxidoreductase
MKAFTTISRYLLGLIFLVFGLNGFLHFIPMPPPTGMAAQFIGALFVSHYLSVVMLIQVVAGTLLLINRFVPVALTLLGPVIVNIFLFHVLMDPGGIPTAILVSALWFLVAYRTRSAFSPIFQQRVDALVASGDSVDVGSVRLSAR